MKENNCAIIQVGGILGKKWSIPIIEELFFEKKIGFNKLQKSMKIISPRILSQRLAQLEKAKLISKKSTQKNNLLNSSYSLTKKGKELQQLINQLKQFGIKWDNVQAQCLETKCSNCEKFIE